VAGPDDGAGRGCGGCDWQHVSASGQRGLLAEVVREQLLRLGKVEVPGLVVEPVAGDADGLGWRTRVRFTVDDRGRPGLRAHRSHDVIPVEHCPIAHPEVDAVGVGTRRWPGATSVEVAVGGAGVRPAVDLPAVDLSAVGLPVTPHVVERLVVVEPGESGRAQVPPLAADASVAVRERQGVRRVRGRAWVAEQVVVDGAVRTFRVGGAGFWQVHPGAAQTLLDAVLAAADPAPGERAVDLYCGVGLFSAGLALRVGVTGTVVAVESDERAVRDARRSLHDLPNLHLVHARVERAVAGGQPDGVLAGADVVVLDPPRTGAGRAVVTAILAARPRVVVYVACDPAALARDVATATDLGYRLDAVRAFALFPMTHHVECVATLTPA
jgi:tRNA/tmRNA/rRNA uracil-C5-methylase (TrmA/RlmC/RlmD family)